MVKFVALRQGAMRCFYGCCVGSSLYFEICVIGYSYRLHKFQGKLKRLIVSSELRLLLSFRIEIQCSASRGAFCLY
jgi:hypothetical protein